MTLRQWRDTYMTCQCSRIQLSWPRGLYSSMAVLAALLASHELPALAA